MIILKSLGLLIIRMDQISDAGRAGNEASKIRQRLCQGHAVQSPYSAVMHLSRLEVSHRDCELG